MTQSSSVHIFSNLSLSSEKCFGDYLQPSCVTSLGCLGLRDCSPRKRARSASLMIRDCPVWRAPCTGSAASHSVAQIQQVLHHHLCFSEETMGAKQDCRREETKTSECHWWNMIQVRLHFIHFGWTGNSTVPTAVQNVAADFSRGIDPCQPSRSVLSDTEWLRGSGSGKTVSCTERQSRARCWSAGLAILQPSYQMTFEFTHTVRLLQGHTLSGGAGFHARTPHEANTGHTLWKYSNKRPGESWKLPLRNICCAHHDIAGST